jgi:hypothetical protein
MMRQNMADLLQVGTGEEGCARACWLANRTMDE